MRFVKDSFVPSHFPRVANRSFTMCELPWLVPFKVSGKYVPTWEVRDSAISMFIRSFISTSFPTFHTAYVCAWNRALCQNAARDVEQNSEKITSSDNK